MNVIFKLFLALYLVTAFIGSAIAMWLDSMIEKLFGDDDQWPDCMA